ncbi:PIR Superfamily Protein [Plasmodium ovale curtisi]|uniref:PIR Superfamily Protein n=1 Tax=Plasmodium ovale curtisi TaxID=864141 RepID=A0A1A8X8C3_PLAOA|nr:PIR Superfamily Protein [Plasmodium ovale curtisi]SBT01493.1 PIR Superfamily Protein [Plasmodium ovale curtisi]
MTEIREKDQVPHIFYNELNLVADVSSLEKLTIYSVIQAFEPGHTAKIILAKSLRNIELIRTKYFDNATKRCRDVNYWFDKETENLESEKERKSISGCAFALFNSIKWNKQDSYGICKREKSMHTTDERELRKNLDDFCEIRNNLRCTMLKSFNDCLQYNNYIEKKKKYFSRETNLCNDNACEIDANCTLNNIDITFPSINCYELHNVKKEDQKESIEANYSSLEIGFFLILSFLALFLISLFLFKMTPLGSLIRNYLIRKNIIKKKMNEEEYDELFQYSFNSEPPDSGNRGYYVDYTTLRN